MLRAFEEDLAAQRASTRVGCPHNGSAVRQRLTSPRRRPRRHRETGEFAEMVLRIIRAYGRRVAAGDPEDLKVMLACRAEMDSAIADAIRTAREHIGWTWTDVGRAAGITKQSAHERWGGS